MSLFRSQEMEFYNLIVPRESAWDVMNALGYYDTIHFVDYDPLLPQLNRPFSNYIKRCDDSLQKVQNIMGEMKNYKIPLEYCSDIKGLLRNKSTSLKDLDEIEIEINKNNRDLQEQQKILQEFQERKNNLIEHIEVLKKAVNIQNEDQGENLRFSQIVGVIDKEDEQRFKRIVFRVTKGNVYVQLVDIEKQFILPDRPPVSKCVFVLLHPGGEVISLKLKRVVETFQAMKFELPTNQEGYDLRINELLKQLEDTENLIQLTITQIDSQLQKFAQISNGCSQIEEVRLFLEKEKYLYQNLNLLKMVGSVFQGQLWLPKDQDQIIQQVLRGLHGNDQHLPSGQLQFQNTDLKPPTYFKLNEFTAGFQEIVNTYGIPRYQEINPGLSTLVTFPFLFGVMFGDMGHGLLLILGALYMCTEDAKNSIFKSLISVRYMFMMMGFFACYNGIIYNDYLSFGLNLFGSCYRLNDGEFQKIDENCVYSFGMDPVWSVSGNQLSFMNSYKMKLAVIIGVIHMTFGIILKGFNALHFGNSVDFYFEFIPQMLLMVCSFGYMDFLIILKWITPFEDTSLAPSVITTMIDMVLQPFNLPEKPLFADAEFQRTVQLILLAIIVICVPTMLFPKPFIIDASNKMGQSRNSEVEINSDHVKEGMHQLQDEEEVQFNNFSHDTNKHPTHDEHESFGDLFVHQSIETIEFVLGSVSNTASYLRLWALSLAHSQLAEVFFDMNIGDHTAEGGVLSFLRMIFNYPTFALSTFGVLMCMDLMECFLHALRLQWVEFQSKFYKADGYLFQAYSYNKIKSQPEDE